MTKKKNVAVVGSGYWGKNLVRNFHALGALRVVVDTAEAGRALAQELAPGVRVEASFERMLEDREVEGVVIATPAETHAALAELALAAGKDVLSEKPLALRYDAAKRVVDLARERGRMLMVGHVLEYHPAIVRLAELVNAGDLGELRYVYSNRLNLGKVRREENILWSFAPHDVAVILRLVGALPARVVAAGAAFIQPRVADVTITQLLFDSGVSAHIFVSWLNPFKEQRLVIVGSKKMASFDDVTKELVLHDQGVDLKDGEPVSFRREGTRLEYPSHEPLRRECEAFLESIRTRTPPLTDGQSALRVLRVLQAAQRSLIAEGQPVVLPLE
jgi:predicted dehydrogenase